MFQRNKTRAFGLDSMRQAGLIHMRKLARANCRVCKIILLIMSVFTLYLCTKLKKETDIFSTAFRKVLKTTVILQYSHHWRCRQGHGTTSPNIS